MGQEFETEELAVAARDKDIENLRKCPTIGERFCPLINGPCVPGCVCFGMPHLGNNQQGGHSQPPPTRWYLYGHYCSNEMFYKEEYNVNSRVC
jgi:hypothetical protein